MWIDLKFCKQTETDRTSVQVAGTSREEKRRLAFCNAVLSYYTSQPVQEVGEKCKQGRNKGKNKNLCQR